MARKRAAEHEARATQIANGTLDELVDGKKNLLVTRENVREVTLQHHTAGAKLKVHSSQGKITLHCLPIDSEKLDIIVAFFNR